MAKKLKTYERLLLGLALSADVLIDIWQEGSAAYKHRHFFDPWLGPDYKPSSLNSSLNYMLKTGYIEKIVKNGEPFLRLTSKANNKLKRDFSIFRMQKRSWDGNWRIVIFDINEESKLLRRALREKLKQLGFGMLQKSVYISPYDFEKDIYEFLETQKLLGKAYIITAKHKLMGDAQELARKVWNIDELEEEYDKLYYKIIHINEVKNKKKVVGTIKNKYLELIQRDPCLPYDLLPEDWLAEKVRKAVVSL